MPSKTKGFSPPIPPHLLLHKLTANGQAFPASNLRHPNKPHNQNEEKTKLAFNKLYIPKCENIPEPEGVDLSCSPQKFICQNGLTNCSHNSQLNLNHKHNMFLFGLARANTSPKEPHILHKPHSQRPAPTCKKKRRTTEASCCDWNEKKQQQQQQQQNGLAQPHIYFE